MHKYAIAVVIWAVINIILAIWGLNSLGTTCDNLTLFSDLKGLLITNVAMASVIGANLGCMYYCYDDDDDELSKLVTAMIFLGSIVTLYFYSYIYKNIDDCATNTGNYKTIVTWYGFFSTIAVLLSSLGYLIWSVKRMGGDKEILQSQERKRRIEKAKKQQEALSTTKGLLKKSLEEERRALDDLNRSKLAEPQANFADYYAALNKSREELAKEPSAPPLPSAPVTQTSQHLQRNDAFFIPSGTGLVRPLNTNNLPPVIGNNPQPLNLPGSNILGRKMKAFADEHEFELRGSEADRLDQEQLNILQRTIEEKKKTG